MKKTLVTLMLLVFVGGLTVCQTSFVFAQEEQAVAETITVSGNLASVDLEKSTITIKVATGEEQKVEEQVLSVNASTTITKADEAVKLADLVIGGKIIVEYIINNNGNLVAQSISVE